MTIRVFRFLSEVTNLRHPWIQNLNFKFLSLNTIWVTYANFQIRIEPQTPFLLHNNSSVPYYYNIELNEVLYLFINIYSTNNTRPFLDNTKF